MGIQDPKTQTSFESDNDPVSQLLSSLKRVEAPNDFDFRVKARIAAGKPADRPASWLPASVRFAVPLALVLLIGGYFAFNALYSLKVTDVPVVAGVQSNDAAPRPDHEDIMLPVNQSVAEHTAVRNPETAEKGRLPEPKRKISSPNPKLGRPDGESIDQSVKSPVVLYRRGLDPNSRSGQISAKNVLKALGVSATFSSTGWNVDSVRGDSFAGHSGVKAGDVIEAINDQPLSEKTTIANKSSLKSIHVLRDGKSVDIGIKP